MADSPTARALAALTLLQHSRFWSGAELAARLRVSPRTLRRDVDRLRGLGYRIDAERGPSGGYRLVAGQELPPLVFTGDEAVALAIALRTAVAHTGVEGFAELAVGAFAKLEQVLPARLRPRLHALQQAATADEPVSPVPLVDAELISVVALACRDRERIRFAYPSAEGTKIRRVEPVRVVQRARLWYAIVFDLDRNDWRTFRLDRMAEVVPTGRRFADRPAPDLAERFAPPTPTVEARVRIGAPYDVVEPALRGHTAGLEPDGEDGTSWTIRSDRVELLAAALVWLSWPFSIVRGPELVAFLSGHRDHLAGAF